MAPKVCVPADFGRHHIGAPSHGNLTFNLQQGLQIKANSIIMSLNSPVIDDLTTNLHLTSLEAEDFSREAVDCFIEASYTGEVDALNLGNFRDVNKMSVVFNVSWLVARCEKYFVSYLDKLDSESSYPDMLFAVEEAVYLLSALKKRDFLNLVVKKMNIISVIIRDNFINQYLSDLSASTSVQIDVCIDIVTTDVHVLVEILIAHLEKGDDLALDENSRYMFKNLNLKSCHRLKPDLHKKLFTVMKNLDNVKKEDYNLILEKLEQSTETQDQNTVKKRAIEVESLSVDLIAPSSLVSYLIPIYLGAILDMLVASDFVDNLYKLIDGIWFLTRHPRGVVISGLSDVFIRALVEIKEQKGWQNIEEKYVNNLFLNKYSTQSSEFFVSLKNCDKLVSKRSKTLHTFSKEFKSTDEFVQEVFEKDNHIAFRLDDPEYADLSLTLFTTSTKDSDHDSFSMKWTAFSEKTRNKVFKLHFALERWKDGKWIILPITWCGKPTYGPIRKTWNWGYIWFGNDQNITNQKEIEGNNLKLNWHSYVVSLEDTKYRFVMFLV